MKKLLTFIIVSLFVINTFAQITITDIDGNPINNDDVITFNTDGDEANLVTLVTNNASGQIELKLKCVSITGADGSDMEFCIGVCFWGMTEGTIYPIASNFYVDAGATTGSHEIHFHHHIQAGDPDVTSYVIKLYEEGNEAGNHVQFTYKYDVNYTGINNIEKSNFSIYPNPATTFFNIKVSEELTDTKIVITNVIGKIIKTIDVQKSDYRFSADELLTGIYFVSLIKDKEVLTTKKLIIN